MRRIQIRLRGLVPAAVAAALMTAGASPLAAQEPRVITFDEAIRIALEQNTTLQAARNAAALDSVSVRQERMQFLPDLRVNSQTTQSYGRFFSQSEGQILDQSTQTVSGGVSSSITLFNGFANTAALQGAKLAREASGLEVGRARQTTVFTVLSNYLSLIEQQEQRRVQQENLEAQQAQEAQIQVYVDAGVRPISDLYQQQAIVANARLNLVQTERALALARTDLVGTLRLDPAADFEFVAPPLDSASTAAPLSGLDTLLARALDNRVDLEAAQARVAAAQQGINVARATRWPSIGLTAGYNTGYTSANDFGFFDQLDQRRGGSVGFNISLPVFDRFSRATTTERARLLAENARLNAENLRQNVALQVRRAYLDYQAAQEQRRAAEAQLRAAELALQTAQQRYEVGAATLVEVTQARASLVQAASALVNARYNLLFQERLMAYYLGDLDPEAISLG